MRFLLTKHIYLSFSILCLLLSSSANLLAQTPSCPTTITVEGRTVLCQGETTVLKAPTGAGLTYQWIKDGVDIAGSTGESIQVSTAGTYQVRVSGGSCQTNTSAGTAISVDPRPNPPGFIVDPTTAACSGTELTFSINAPIADLVYTWDFGDGSTARGETVTHTYDVRGTGVETYTVSVFATSKTSSCESEPVLKDIQVRRLPEISFTEKDNFQTCLPDSIADEDIEVTAEITNTTQEPYLTDIRSYTIDWGDGSTPIQYRQADFPVSNPNPYTAVGDYEIVITALAGNGCTETFTQTYSVSKEPKAGFEIDKKREKDDQVPPCVPVIVTPSDTASGGGLSYNWSVQPAQGWEFESGDSTSAAPVFKFTESGVYTIEQIVSNSCGSDTTSQGIVVGWPQVQPPTGGTFCGPTSIDFRGFGASGGGGPGGGGGEGDILIDKNLGEQVTVNVKITGPKSISRTFNSENFNFNFNFDTPGRYVLTVEATNECGSSDQITGGQSTPIEYIILRQPTAPTVQNPGTVCEGDAVTLTPTGGGSIFAWFDDNTPGATPLEIGSSFTTPALSSGVNNFYVAALDTANGITCQSPLREIPVTVRERISNNTIEGDNVRRICKGGTVATFTGSTPTGGDRSIPYTYTWIASTTGPDSGFASASGVNNNKDYKPEAISTTTWFRRVVSSASCTPDTSNVVQVVAVDPVPKSANTISPSQEICEGDTPQQLVGTTPSGGAGAPYTFLWEISRVGPNTGFSPAPESNNAANYTIQTLQPGDTWFRRQVMSGGCATPSDPVKITVFPQLANNTISPPDQEVCSGTVPAALTGSSPSGGTGTYTYEWLSSKTGTKGSFTPADGTNNMQSYTPGRLTQTTYFKRVVSSAACNADTSAVAVIRIKPQISGNSITASQEVCSGTAPQELTGTILPGGATYRWESSISGPNSGFTPATGNNTNVNYQPQAITRNTWFRRVAIVQGCENASEAISITVLPLPASPTLVVKDASACVGGTVTLSIQNPNGKTYEWYTTATGGNPIFEGSDFTTPELTQSTSYFVQAVDVNACASASRTEARVTVVTPTADAGEDVTIIQGRTTELRASGGTSYIWEPATGLSNPNVSNPVASPDETTTYTVTVTTAEGCEATDEVTVTVIPALTIPNAFTPNRDNVNEVWEIGNIENYPNVRVEIFNRWGSMIFSSVGYGAPWDGTYNGENLPVATYYYMIYLDDTEKPISGHVTIIR